MVDNSDFLDPDGFPGDIRRDTLRDRIITILEANFDDAPPSLSMEDMADAVIAELHLDVTFHYTTSVGTEVCLKGYYSVGGQ